MLYREAYPYIMNVGVELEGGISEEALDALYDEYERDSHFSCGSDASVSVPPPNPDVRWINDVELRYWSSDMDALLGFVEKAFKLGFRQNRTCGNHHHVVFSNHVLTASLFATPQVVKLFVKEYAKFAHEMLAKRGTHKYLDRMSNSYCRIPLDERQIYKALACCDRYYAINFSALFEHRTIEVRILPYAESFQEFKEMHTWLVSTLNRIAEAAYRRMNRILSIEVSI